MNAECRDPYLLGLRNLQKFGEIGGSFPLKCACARGTALFVAGARGPGTAAGWGLCRFWCFQLPGHISGHLTEQRLPFRARLPKVTTLLF